MTQDENSSAGDPAAVSQLVGEVTHEDICNTHEGGPCNCDWSAAYHTTIPNLMGVIAAFDRAYPELYWHVAKGKITAGEPLYGAIITDTFGKEIGDGESDVSADRMEAAGLIELVPVTKEALEDSFAAERGIEPGGMMYRVTDAGRAALAATATEGSVDDRCNPPLPALSPVRDHDLHDRACRQQVPQCLAFRPREPGPLARLDHRDCIMGASSDEPRAVDRLRPQSYEVEQGMTDLKPFLDDMLSMSTGTDGRTLQIHFSRPVTKEDREAFAAAHNAIVRGQLSPSPETRLVSRAGSPGSGQPLGSDRREPGLEAFPDQMVPPQSHLGATGGATPNKSAPSCSSSGNTVNALLPKAPPNQIAIGDDRLVDAVTALAEAGIPVDVQELLIYGNVSAGIPPNALQKALKAANPPAQNHLRCISPPERREE